MRHLTFILFILILSCKQVPGQDAETIQSTSWEAISSYDSTGNVIHYNYLKPLKEEEGHLYPLVLFLHGAGERGDDNAKQLVHIAPIFESDSIRKKYPSYIVFPQCPQDDFWAAMERVEGNWRPVSSGPPAPSLSRVMNLVDNLIELYPIDTNRIYISGLSMGGFGTFDYLARAPHKFAAAIPICGGGDTTYAKNYAHLPMKIFHGADDVVVSPQLSRDMYEALQRAGARSVEYIEFPGVGHDAWTPAFNHKGLLEWLFSQKK